MLRATKGVFTLTKTKTDTETETEKMGKKPNGNLCWYQSLCSLNTYTSHFFICICLGVGQCKHTMVCLPDSNSYGNTDSCTEKVTMEVNGIVPR